MSEGEVNGIAKEASPAATTEKPTKPESSTSSKLEGDHLKAALQKQLEFYFSKENLSSDAFLVSKMNSELFVPIDIVANFSKVRALTNNKDLIVEVLRNSSQVVVDTAGEKVKPNIPRNTIILRDIPADIPEEEVRTIFKTEGCAPVKSLRYDVGDTWFVSFETEEEAVDTMLIIRQQKFHDKPIQCRIKSENVLKSVYNPYTSQPSVEQVDMIVNDGYGYYVSSGPMGYGNGRQWMMGGMMYPYGYENDFNSGMRHQGERRNRQGNSGARSGNRSQGSRRNDQEGAINNNSSHSTPSQSTPPPSTNTDLPLSTSTSSQHTTTSTPSASTAAATTTPPTNTTSSSTTTSTPPQHHQQQQRRGGASSQQNASTNNSNTRYNNNNHNQGRRKSNNHSSHSHGSSRPHHEPAVQLGPEAFPPLPGNGAAVPVPKPTTENASALPKKYSVVATSEPKPAPEQPKESKKESEPSKKPAATPANVNSTDKSSSEAKVPSQPAHPPTESKTTKEGTGESRKSGRNHSSKQSGGGGNRSDNKERNRSRDRDNRRAPSGSNEDRKQHHSAPVRNESPAAPPPSSAPPPSPAPAPSPNQPMSYAQILKTAHSKPKMASAPASAAEKSSEKEAEKHTTPTETEELASEKPIEIAAS